MSDKSRASKTLPEGAGFAISIAGRVNAATIAAGNILKKCMVALQNVKIESETSNNPNGSEVIEVKGYDIAATQMDR